MTKSNQFIKSLKNISKIINSLLERNLNKLKFDNLKILASNNKIILTFVAVFVLFVTYLLLPTFYKQGEISKELRNNLLTKFNLDLNFNQRLVYNVFPRPHFISEGSSIVENQKIIADINQIKIYVSLKNLATLNKFNVKEVILEKVNFELNTKNSNFFINILNNNFSDANLKIINSNIFFRNLENEVLFINKIKKLKYYYDQNELENVFISDNEIFNTPFSLKAINIVDEKKLFTKLNLDSAKLQIENIINYDGDIKLGSSSIFFNKKKSIINYKINKNFFEFNFFDELDKNKFVYNGKIYLKPFYSTFEGSTEEIDVSYLFGTNAIIAALLKTEIFNNKNIDFKLSINANKIQNSRNFINIFFKSKIQDGLIDIDDTEIEWKNSSIIKLTDTLIFANDGKLFLEGKSQINILDVQNIYKFLLTPKNFRKKINIIDFSFIYSFEEKTIILSNIMIDGKYNQKVNEKLENVYFLENKLQNKIYIKNVMNNLVKAYAG